MEHAITMNNRKIYCINTTCPFTICEKHLNKLKPTKYKEAYVKVADYDGVCRDYISYVLNNIKEK